MIFLRRGFDTLIRDRYTRLERKRKDRNPLLQRLIGSWPRR